MTAPDSTAPTGAAANCINCSSDEKIDKAFEISGELLRLDEALEDLGQSDARLAKLVELRYFAGLTFKETAEVLGVSVITVKMHWKLARKANRRKPPFALEKAF